MSKAPKGWIRWYGLGMFLGIVGVIFAMTYLGITLILKNKIESVASEAWGAKVEIARLDIGLFPIRFGVINLVLTDPDKPMENLIDVGFIGGSVSFYHLVVGRTVIEEISIKELKFNQPRSSSGALEEVNDSDGGRVTAANKKSSFTIPSVVIPDLDDVLSRDNLQTLQMAESIQAQLNALAKDWNTIENNLPNQTKLDSYQQRFQALLNGKYDSLEVIQQKQKEFESLQRDVKEDIKSIEEGKDLLQTKLPKLQEDVLALKSLPAQDLARLQEKYSLDATGLSNLTYLLYGSKIQSYVDTAQDWYLKAKPFIHKWQQDQAIKAEERAQQQAKRLLGTDVVFTEFDPQPDFIIKRVILSSEIPWGRLQLKILDINGDQPVSKRPIRYFVELQPLGQTAVMKMVGESNFIKEGEGFHVVDIAMQDYQIKDWELSDDKKLPVLMQRAVSQVTGKFVLTEHEKVNGKVDLVYQNVDFDLSRTSSKDVKRYVAPIFEDITEFSVEADIRGNLFAPAIGAKSDLDKKLSKAFNKALNKEISLAKKQMRVEFDKLVAEQMEPINAELSNLLGENVNISASANSLQEILAKDSDTFFAEQKQKLLDQAKAKIEAEKKKLEQEANARIAAEKQRLEAEKKRLKNEAEKRAKEEQKKLEKELLKQFKF